LSQENKTEYRMTLAQFYRYLKDKGQELKDCYQEIEEVQFQFNDIFKRELEVWKQVFSYCFPLVLQGRRTLPQAFQAIIDQAEREELARLRQEIVDAGKTVTDGRLELDRLLAQAKGQTDVLRKDNPTVDRAEEKLKARVAGYQDEFAQAYEEFEALRSRPFGGIVHFAAIRRLERRQRVAKKEQASALKKLREVRNKWLDHVNEVGEVQSSLREQWQAKSTEVSQAQGKREQLEANLEPLAEQAAVQKVLQNLSEAPALPGELGSKLAELAQRNQVRKDYEHGLGAVAEALGLIKGVSEGLQRFRRSVGTVVEEQKRFSLAQVQVPLPRRVAELNQTWTALQAKVKDEKYMGSHPIEFGKVVETYVSQRLTDESIQYLFESMGEALSKATAAWK
jgi:DNA repair exonuclease SbcCD ATPase subunit